jgi:O-antigen/teichoic acid export membrane protein
MSQPRVLARPALLPIRELRSDPLVRNSFFLMATTALGAGSGFVFWLIVARLYPTAEVGRASSLLSSVALLSYFSLFGFSNALIRFLPTSRDRARDAGTAISVVVLCSLVISAGFGLAAPWLAGDLGFLRSTGSRLAVFVLRAAGAAVNLLTDSIFVAVRATRTNLLINGILMSTVKLGLPVLAVAYGAFGIFAASGAASTLAAIVSLAVIRKQLAIRARALFSRASLRAMLNYSLGSYLSGSLNLLPQIALPIIVLHELGPVLAAVYFVAFQISNLVSAASYAIGEALFAEGSHEPGALRRLALRSGGMMLALTATAVAAVAALAVPILRLFGDDYARHGTATLVLFAFSSLAVAFNTWAGFLLKVQGRLGRLAASNLVFIVVILAVALGKLHDGLIWAPIAWGLGNLLCGAVAAVGLAGNPREEQPA